MSLLHGNGSNVVWLVTLAQLVMVPTPVTLAVMFRNAEVPFNKVPMVHIPVFGSYVVNPDAMWET
ncbi:MAG: hypothetical protein Q8S06_10025 [Methanobacteriaceae archaeon]|nr:hypothetical protein [Methanobacteriaceae archaeon]